MQISYERTVTAHAVQHGGRVPYWIDDTGTGYIAVAWPEGQAPVVLGTYPKIRFAIRAVRETYLDAEQID